MKDLVVNYVLKGKQPNEGELYLKYEQEWSDETGLKDLNDRVNQCVWAIEAGQVTERFPDFNRFTITILAFQQPPPGVMSKMDKTTAMLGARGIGLRLHLVMVEQPAKSGMADLWRAFRSWLKPERKREEN